MDLMKKYIPREYLALKINYCRQQLEKLPIIVLQENITCAPRIVIGKHRYLVSSENGKYCLELNQKRESLERELQFYQTIWDCNFKGEPFPECEPIRANRTLFIGNNDQVVMNKELFDSLENDANTKYPKSNNYIFDGIRYRSAAEREIAIFYTDMGIPFKYEPRITLRGLTFPIFSDFILYFEELDNCKFHEHFGIKNSSEYLKETKIKYGNYTNAGLIPDIDVLFTYANDENTFDPRFLSAKLNAAIYGTICINK